MRSSAAHLALVVAWSAACSRTPETQTDTRAPTAPAQLSRAPSGSPTPAPGPETGGGYELPLIGARLVAIGDIHGDLRALRRALQLAGAIDSDSRWVGRNLTVVQTGDQVDRGDQDREVLDVIEQLEASAKAAGGAFYVLNGNHELMNARFDFRYVTRRSFASFDEFASRAGELKGKLPDPELGRAAAFMPGAPYAQKLSRHLTVAKVGDSLFAHGGVLPGHVEYGLDRINREASAFLAGKTRDLPAILTDEDGPVWLRRYGGPEVDDASCELLGRVLKQVGAKRLIVGHTVQEHGISSACQERVFRIDIGLSAFYGEKPPQALEVTAAGARVLRSELRPDSSARGSKKGQTSDSAVDSAP